jgi:hypothetical protein
VRVPWLSEVLRGAGCQVTETDGWVGRGKPLTEIRGVVLHHTATGPNVSDSAVCRLLRDGRPDLAGPLAQMGLGRSGRWYLICDGKANHNGYGEWGNASLGIEAFNDGQGEAWPVIQLDQWQRGVAAILTHLGLDAEHAKGHRETDPKRKVDPRGVGLPAFRKRVDSLMHPAPPPHPIIEEDDVFTYRDARDNRVWIVEAGKRRKVERPELGAYIAAGVLKEPKTLTAEQADVMVWNYPEKK